MQSRMTLKTGLQENESPRRRLEISPYDLVGHFLRRKRLLGAVVLSVMVLAAAVTLIMPNRYRAVATILPSDNTSQMTPLKSLADLTGMPSMDNSSSELYPVILGSQAIQTGVLAKTYSFAHDGRPMTVSLPDYFGLDNPDLLRRRLAGISRISAERKTGVITLTVETTIPELSQAVASEYLAQLESFNLHQRRSQARENAGYLSRQMTATKEELAAAEDNLQQFRQYNSDWPVSSDAELVKELTRLQREVEVKTQTYLYLSREYEAAQLEAQKDVPIVSILDRPAIPMTKSGPHRTLTVLLAGLAALVTMLFVLTISYAASGHLPGSHQEGWRTLQQETASAFPRVARVAARLHHRFEQEPVTIDGR